MLLCSSLSICSGVLFCQLRSIVIALVYLMFSHRHVAFIPIIIIFIIYLLSFKDKSPRPPRQHETDSSQLRYARPSVAQREIHNHDIALKTRTDNPDDPIERQLRTVTSRIQAPLTPVHKHVSLGKEPVQSCTKPPRLQDAMAHPVSSLPRAHPFAAMLCSRLDRLLRLRDF